jgi:hypothetical protein
MAVSRSKAATAATSSTDVPDLVMTKRVSSYRAGLAYDQPRILGGYDALDAGQPFARDVSILRIWRAPGAMQYGAEEHVWQSYVIDINRFLLP